CALPISDSKSRPCSPGPPPGGGSADSRGFSLGGQGDGCPALRVVPTARDRQSRQGHESGGVRRDLPVELDHVVQRQPEEAGQTPSIERTEARGLEPTTEERCQQRADKARSHQADIGESLQVLVMCLSVPLVPVGGLV